ncbi:hypothetical protein VIGAN_05268400, partial [Vigna angularis var. angularis]
FEFWLKESCQRLFCQCLEACCIVVLYDNSSRARPLERKLVNLKMLVFHPLVYKVGTPEFEGYRMTSVDLDNFCGIAGTDESRTTELRKASNVLMELKRLLLSLRHQRKSRRTWRVHYTASGCTFREFG